MLPLIIVSIFVTVSYILLLTSLIIGWKRINKFEKGSENPFPIFISVIISAKNEENNISQTLNSLLHQTLNSNSFEVLIIDDFSSDNTNNIIKEFCKQQSSFQLLSLNEHKGKKFALDYGIKKAKGELIVTTDADCEFQAEWLQTIKDYYISSNAKMIIAPVLIKSKSWFEHMQALDFFSLMVSGAAATGIKRPIMNNGANLAFSKEAYLGLNDPTNKKVSSGDDIFLLLKMKEEYPSKIHFLKSEKATVYTKPKESFTAYINQRKRWASKSKHYRDFDIIYTAVAVLLTNALLLAVLVSGIFYTNLLFIFLSLFTFKSIFDFTFLYETTHFFQQKPILKYFLLVQFANVFLIPFLAFSGIFTKTKWKGKMIR